MQSAEVALSFTLGQNKLQFWLGLNWIAVGGGYWLVGGGRGTGSGAKLCGINF